MKKSEMIKKMVAYVEESHDNDDLLSEIEIAKYLLDKMVQDGMKPPRLPGSGMKLSDGIVTEECGWEPE